MDSAAAGTLCIQTQYKCEISNDWKCAIDKLRHDQLIALLNYSLTWNTNNKNCIVTYVTFKNKSTIIY